MDSKLDAVDDTDDIDEDKGDDGDEGDDADAASWGGGSVAGSSSGGGSSITSPLAGWSSTYVWATRQPAPWAMMMGGKGMAIRRICWDRRVVIAPNGEIPSAPAVAPPFSPPTPPAIPPAPASPAKSAPSARLGADISTSTAIYPFSLNIPDQSVHSSLSARDTVGVTAGDVGSAPSPGVRRKIMGVGHSLGAEGEGWRMRKRVHSACRLWDEDEGGEVKRGLKGKVRRRVVG